MRTANLLGFILFLVVASAYFLTPAQAQQEPVYWLSTGDSYSSGEGVRNNEGACAQHKDDAWGPKAADILRSEHGWNIPNVVFTACSGHLAQDLFNPNPSAVAGDGNSTSQWEWGETQPGFPSDGKFDVITLSYGGNDIGFSDILLDCLTMFAASSDSIPGRVATLAELTLLVPDDIIPYTGDSCDKSEEDLKQRIDWLFAPQSDCAAAGSRYSEDYANFGCEIVIDENQNPALSGSLADFWVHVAKQKLRDRGTLIVQGYPALFAESAEWGVLQGRRCHGVKRADANMLGRVAEYFDDEMRKAVLRVEDEVAAAGAHIAYASPLSTFKAGGHSLCGDGDDWINGMITLRQGDEPLFYVHQAGPSSVPMYAPNVNFRVRPLGAFHPNADAHAAMAENVAGIVRRIDQETTTEGESVDPEQPILGESIDVLQPLADANTPSTFAEFTSLDVTAESFGFEFGLGDCQQPMYERVLAVGLEESPTIPGCTAQLKGPVGQVADYGIFGHSYVAADVTRTLISIDVQEEDAWLRLAVGETFANLRKGQGKYGTWYSWGIGGFSEDDWKNGFLNVIQFFEDGVAVSITTSAQRNFEPGNEIQLNALLETLVPALTSDISNRFGLNEVLPAMTAEESASESSLVSLWSAIAYSQVPSICNHPAATLLNGANPGIADGKGFFELRPTLESGGAGLVHGVQSDDGPLTIVAASCSAGGVSWPAVYLAFDQEGSYHSHLDTTIVDWEPYGVRDVARGEPVAMTVDNGELVIDVNALIATDPECCPSAQVKLRVTVTDRLSLIPRTDSIENSCDDDRLVASFSAGDQSVAICDEPAGVVMIRRVFGTDIDERHAVCRPRDGYWISELFSGGYYYEIEASENGGALVITNEELQTIDTVILASDSELGPQFGQQAPC